MTNTAVSLVEKEHDPGEFNKLVCCRLGKKCRKNHCPGMHQHTAGLQLSVWYLCSKLAGGMQEVVEGKKSNENHDGREGTVVIGSDLSFMGWQPTLAQADKMNRYNEQSNHRQLFSTACTWSDTQSPSSGMSRTVLIEKVRSWSQKYGITFPIMCESMVSCSQCWQKSSLPPLLNIQMGHIYTFPLAAKSALDN